MVVWDGFTLITLGALFVFVMGCILVALAMKFFDFVEKKIRRRRGRRNNKW